MIQATNCSFEHMINHGKVDEDGNFMYSDIEKDWEESKSTEAFNSFKSTVLCQPMNSNFTVAGDHEAKTQQYLSF